MSEDNPENLDTSAVPLDCFVMFYDEHGTADYCPDYMAHNYDMKIRQLELTIEDLEAAHLWLDDKKIPRAAPNETVYSLVGRINIYKET